MSHTKPPIRRHGVPLLQRQASSPRRIWFRLVDRQVDRHGTIIEPAGVDLTAYKANPVFLWMHQSGGEGLPTQPPPDVVIGTVVNFDQTLEHLDIEVDFDDDGPDGLASTCFRKVKAGRIRMVSIGCSPTSEDTVNVNGLDVPRFPTTELLECSLVIIGSNRGSLVLSRAAMAAELRSLGDDAEVILEPSHSPSQETPMPPLPAAIQRPRVPDQIATVAVFNHANEMLWGRRRDNAKWTTPGGHMLDGEDPMTAAYRELHEETTIDARGLQLPFEYLGPVEVVGGDGKTRYVHCFRCSVGRAVGVTPSSHLDPDHEVDEWRWVAMDDGDMLPPEYRDNLHAPRNALATLGVFRAVPGDAATQALLQDVVDDGVLSHAALQHTVFHGDGLPDDEDDVDFDMYDDDDEGDGIVVKSNPVTRGVVAFKSYPMVEGAWDADAAVARWRRWASSDGSGDKDKIDWGKYAQMFLWFDSSDRENFAAYVFPHHDIRGDKPVTVWQGVVAAAARIDQSKGIPAADVQRMKAHLASHYKEAGKTAPWQRRSLRDVGVTIEKAWPRTATLTARAATYIPQPIATAFRDDVKDGPAHTPADEDGAYLFAQLTPHALVFPASKFTVADAVVWAKDHGYIGMGAVQVDASASKQGLVVTEPAILLEQLPANIFQPSVFGPGLKWSTVVYPNQVACVYGVLKTKRLRIGGRRALASAYLSFIDATMSPTSRAELNAAAARRTLPDGLAAASWCPRSLGAVRAAPAPYTKDLDRIARQLSDTRTLHLHRDADMCADLSTTQELIARTTRTHNIIHYLATTNKFRAAPAAAHTGATQMKRTPEARNVMRSLIAHAMEGADLHARAMEDGHIADESRALHHAMAMRYLDHAADMQDMYRTVWMGDKASQEIVVDGGAVGEVYGTPNIAEGELKLRFSQVSAKVGKLPVSLRSLIKAELGTEDREIVEEKLINFKGIVERFTALQSEHARGLAAQEKLATEKLITEAEEARLVSPAEVKRFRGVDPATGAVVGQPWSKARVERFVEERRSTGPIADIARPGQERTVTSPQQDMTPSSTAPKTVVRYGNMAPPSNPAAISSLAADIARHVKGVKAEDIMGQVEAASQLPNSEGHAALKRANAMK